MAVAFDASNEVVIERQAAGSEIAQRGNVPFNVGRENPRRRARGAATDAARVNEDHACAAGGELVGNGAADDASADDRDVHRGILSGSLGGA